MLLPALSTVLCACSLVSPQPDLARLYVSARSDVAQPPVVIIPGVMGSLLNSPTQGEIWVGSLADVAFGNYGHAALAIDPVTLEPDAGDVVPVGITSRFAGRDFYQPILSTLEDVGGFTHAVPGSPVDPGRRYYYLFAYDWRLDNVHTVKRLADFIEQVRVDHGRPDLKVDIIAHSMGGLVTRYYLRYGPTDVTTSNDFPVTLYGGSRVRRVVLLGTPNLGSVESMKTFMAGRRIGLGRVPPEVLATFPAFYQLLPHPINDWLVDVSGQRMDIDPFDLVTWQRFRWSVFDPRVRQRIRDSFTNAEAADAHLDLLERYFHHHLERARRFMWSLTIQLEAAPWTLVVFGGDCELTPARMVVQARGSDFDLYLRPAEVRDKVPGVDYDRLMLEPGDGRVTKASLLARESLDPAVPRHRYSFFPLAYPLFLCSRHSQLTNNVAFQNNLLQFLLSRDGP